MESAVLFWYNGDMLKFKANFGDIFRKIGGSFYRLLILALILYLGLALFRQINNNYQTNLQIDSLKTDISSIQGQNINLENLLVYYQSATYKELEARKRMGLKKEGEKVLISPENKDSQPEEFEQTEKSTDTQKVPNYQKWFQLILGKELSLDFK